MKKNKSQLILEVGELILSGGRRTTASNVRLLLGDIFDSMPNIVDSGFIFDDTAGYSQTVDLSNPLAFASVQYVIDSVASAGSESIHVDGSNSPEVDISWNGKRITNIAGIQAASGGFNLTDQNNFVGIVIDNSLRYLVGDNGDTSNPFVDFSNISEGFAINTQGIGGRYGKLKFDNLMANRDIQFQDIEYTGVADISDITALSSVYAPLAGGFSFTGNVNGVTPTQLNYLSGASSNIQNQINNINSGLSWKVAARILVGTNVNISSPGATLDGAAMTTGDRVVLNAQSTASQNGVYVWNGSAVAMTRSTDCSTGGTGSTGVLGMTIAIEEGTSADQIWILTTNAPITIGTTSLAYAKSSATTYTASNGIVLTGNNFTLDNSYFSGAFTLSGGVATIGAAYVTNAMLAGSITDANILSATNWNTAYTNRITSLTTSGASGSATLSGNVLNIPNYTLVGLGGFANPMSASGDIIYGGTSGVPTRLPKGTDTYVLTLVSGLPSWVAASAASPLTTKGDLYTYDSANQRLPVGGNGQLVFADSTQATGLKWRNILNSDLPNYTLTSDSQALGSSQDLQTSLNRLYGGELSSLKEVGRVVYNLFATSGELSNFTNTGTATFAFATPGLSVSGGSSNYSNYYTNSYVTMLNRYELAIEFTSTVAGSGIAIGFLNMGVRVDLSSGGTRGTLYLDNSNSGVTANVATSATKLTFTDSTDTLRLSVKRYLTKVLLKVENITTPSNAPVYLEYQQILTSGNPALQSLGNPTIYAYGGTQILSKFEYINKEMQRCNLLLMGDSNMVGWYQGSTPWSSVLASNFNGHIGMLATPGATTLNLTAVAAELNLIKPRYVFLNIGTNDAVGATVLSTFQTQYAALVKIITDSGAIPILGTVIPNSNSTVNALLVTYNTWISSTYGSLFNVVDTFTAQALAGAYNPIYNSGTHMTPLGGLNFYNTLNSALLSYNMPASNIWSNFITHGSTTLLNNTGGKVIDFSGIPGQTNIDFYLTNVLNTKCLTLNSAASAVNFFTLVSKAAGTSPQMQVTGTDTNIGWDFLPKGVGGYYWRSNVVNGSGTAQHIFVGQAATSGEAIFHSLFNSATSSTSNKSTILLAALNASSAATVKTYIGSQTVTNTAGAEDTSFFVDNTIAGARVSVFSMVKGDMSLPYTNGTRIGITASQKLSLWGAAPIVQPTTSISAATFAANTAGTLNDSATWDGYTIGQIVKALRNIGALA